MNAPQRWILVSGLVALAVAGFFAPFRYTGHNELARLVGREVTFEGTYTAPLWAGKESAEGPMSRAHPQRDHFLPMLDTAELQTGRLELYWIGIAIVTLLAVLIASGAKPKADPST